MDVVEKNETFVAPEVSVGSEVFTTVNDADYIQNLLLQKMETQPTASIEHQEVLTKPERRNETIRQLVEHYGGQTFQYGNYRGTITDIIDLCPPVGFIVDQGFDTVVSWIDAYKEDLAEDTEQVGDDEPELPNTTKLPQEKEIDTFTAVAAEQKDETSVKHHKKPVDVEKSPTIPKKVKQKQIIEKKPFVKSVQSEKSPAMIPKATNDRETTAPITAVEDKVVLKDQSSENDAFVATRTDEVHETDLAEFIADNFESTREVPQPVVMEVPEVLEAWTLQAEKQAPLEVLLTSMIEMLPVESNELGIIETIDIDDDALESLLPPELKAPLVQIRKVKYAIEQLAHAKTKEECDVWADEVIKELGEFMIALGYDNPEQFIREFLAMHPLASLYELIASLERALKEQIRLEVARTTQPHGHKRHAGVGRFVSYVLNVLSLRSPLSDFSS